MESVFSELFLIVSTTLIETNEQSCRVDQLTLLALFEINQKPM